MDVLTTAAGFAQHPRDVWFVGDVREPAFQPLLGQLATRARMRIWRDTRALREAANSAARMPGAILVASSRGGPLAMSPLESLRTSAPSSTIALLLGPWSGGVLVKQKLPAGVERVAWHETERLGRLIGFPLLAAALHTGSESRLVWLEGFAAADAEIVLDACSDRGVPAVRSLDGRSQTSDVGIILWRISGFDALRRAELAALHARRSCAVVIAIVDSLRPCEAADLTACGCGILSWPCELEALEALIDRLARPRAERMSVPQPARAA